MTEQRKFSLKTYCYTSVIAAFCIVITCRSEARDISRTEIYSTLTKDTTPLTKKDTVPVRTNNTLRRDTLAGLDTVPAQRTDTFSLRISSDTLDAPVEYEAADSGVLLVKEKKFILYGRTKTVHKDITLTAPKVEFDQQSNTLTAFNQKDSLGNVVLRARFQRGEESFHSDTIRFNFKTQKGVTTNTYTKHQEIFLQFEQAKKVDAVTTFARQFTMTTCEYDHPHFGFVGNKGKFINNKIAVTGPIHPEFEGVPVPVILPFGIFPLKQGRRTGLLPVNFTATEQFGLGLEGIGYYQVLNDYLDVTLRGNIYSYGGWSVNLIPSYRKRYKYNGTLSLSYQRTKFNFKGDPDFNLQKTFNISWNHVVDSRAKPGVSFSANVNAGSTRFNQFVASNPRQPFTNQLYSSIAYSKTWKGNLPLNLTLNANHNQNNNTRLVNVTLPDMGFTVPTLYPFQRKEAIGAAKWYEKIGIGYSGVARNQLSFYDTAQVSINKILDTMQWGAQHRFPINMSLPPLGPLIVSPFISYEETWLTRRMSRQWNDVAKKVDTLYDREGLFIDRQLSFGIGMNTALYGLFSFNKGRTQVRHVVRPNFNFNYRPNLSRKYYDVIQVDTNGRRDIIPQFEPTRNLFSGYGYGRFGGITFGIDNNLEMKVPNRKDTTGQNQTKKIRLVDGFGFTSGYNFLADSLKLQPFNIYFRTTLFEKISITAQGVYSPYQRDSFGRDVNQFIWQGDRFRLGRLRSGSISLSTSFESKPRDPNQQQNQRPTRQISDPTLLADQQRLQEYMQQNPGEFVDFNIPWKFNIAFSLFFNDVRTPDFRFRRQVQANVSFGNSFSLTPKWNITTNGYYDFSTMQLSMFTMTISRDLHCWQMSATVTPVGAFRMFSINIAPKSGLLQDLKVNRTRYFYDY